MHEDDFAAGGQAAQGLAEGEVFTALEQTQVGGRWRVRMSRGWVSLTAASGRPLCVAEAAVQLFLQSVPVLQQLGETGLRRRSHFHSPLYSFDREPLRKYAGWCMNGFTAWD